LPQPGGMHYIQHTNSKNVSPGGGQMCPAWKG
jgi:hypothetical protein